MRNLLAALLALLQLPVAAAVVLLDWWAGVSAYLSFDAGVLALSFTLSLAAFRLSRRRWYLLPPAATALLLLLLRRADLSPVKPAVRAVAAIRPGMAEAEVRSILEHAFPPGGPFRRPDLTRLHTGFLSFCLDPDDGRYNAAVVTIRLEHGRCVSAQFSPD